MRASKNHRLVKKPLSNLSYDSDAIYRQRGALIWIQGLRFVSRSLLALKHKSMCVAADIHINISRTFLLFVILNYYDTHRRQNSRLPSPSSLSSDLNGLLSFVSPRLENSIPLFYERHFRMGK